jgi:hypothetical protein
MEKNRRKRILRQMYIGIITSYVSVVLLVIVLLFGIVTKASFVAKGVPVSRSPLVISPFFVYLIVFLGALLIISWVFIWRLLKSSSKRLKS